MRLAPIDTAAALRQARDIYEAAFVPEEKRPWPDIIAGAADGRLCLRGIYDGDSLIGMVTTWILDDIQYVEHLCISSECRGKGTGSQTVRCLIADAAPRTLLLETEPDGSTPMASRRISFYERNGLRVIDRTYTQPPYAPGLPSVPLYLMASAEVADTARLHRLLHTHVYGC